MFRFFTSTGKNELGIFYPFWRFEFLTELAEIRIIASFIFSFSTIVTGIEESEVEIIRESIIQSLANILFGDIIAAEFILLNIISKMYESFNNFV